MRLADWVDEVKATGGVPDSDPDTLAALRSAAALCWDEIDRKGYSRNAILEHGIKWVAAFMVSCARHPESDFNSIFVHSDQQQMVMRREAARNSDVIGEILKQAASAGSKLFDSAIVAVGLHWSNAPSRRGNGNDD